jgi:hypothetical protein
VGDVTMMMMMMMMEALFAFCCCSKFSTAGILLMHARVQRLPGSEQSNYWQ